MHVATGNLELLYVAGKYKEIKFDYMQDAGLSQDQIHVANWKKAKPNSRR
jgi:hypothetical protein